MLTLAREQTPDDPEVLLSLGLTTADAEGFEQQHPLQFGVQREHMGIRDPRA